MTPRDLAVAARDAGRVLQALSSAKRAAVLHRVADALDANRDQIAEANSADIAACAAAVAAGELSQALADRRAELAATLGAAVRSTGRPRTFSLEKQPSGRLVHLSASLPPLDTSASL